MGLQGAGRDGARVGLTIVRGCKKMSMKLCLVCCNLFTCFKEREQGSEMRVLSTA